MLAKAKLAFRRLLLDAQQTSMMPPGLRRRLLVSLGATIHPSAYVAAHVFVGDPRNLTIGKDCAINVCCVLDGCDRIEISEGVKVAPGVTIITGSHTIAADVMRRGAGSHDFSAPVIIERGCWIGTNTSILPGVTIREGCVIGAGTLIRQETQANGLYGNRANERGWVSAGRIRDLAIQFSETSANAASKTNLSSVPPASGYEARVTPRSAPPLPTAMLGQRRPWAPARRRSGRYRR